MINPSIGGVGDSNGTAYATTTTANVGDNASISFALANEGGAEIDDNSTVSSEVVPGIISYITNTIKLTTKNIDKYYVGVQAASGSTSELVGTTNKATISGVGKDISPASFGDNTWGYALSDNTSTNNSDLLYNSLPTYSTNTPVQYISTSNVADGSHNLKLTFAAKINANKPADHYTTKVMVSVAADAKSIPTFSEITYMQEMTPATCDTAQENESKTLIDRRDNSAYTVTKLKDTNDTNGRCWMTQNLRLINKTITSSDSDLMSGSFTVPESDDNSWKDAGAYIAHARYQNDTSNGAYYNHFTATAGASKEGVNSGTMSTSICPKGWTLPPAEGSGSYTSLLTAYGITDYESTQNQAGKEKLMAAPLNFVAAGWVGVTNWVTATDPDILYWSATLSNGSASALAVHGYQGEGTNVNANNTSYGRAVGASVRCVAR